MNKIKDFLIEAKKQTYANNLVERMASTRLNSKDYEYKKDNMIYHDTYFGGTRFIGEEVVYIDNKTYWSMNYYGVTLDETLWLSQKGMAKVFEVGIPAISKHLKNIFEEKELDESMVVSKMKNTTIHGAIKGKTQTTEIK